MCHEHCFFMCCVLCTAACLYCEHCFIYGMLYCCMFCAIGTATLCQRPCCFIYYILCTVTCFMLSMSRHYLITALKGGGHTHTHIQTLWLTLAWFKIVIYKQPHAILKMIKQTFLFVQALLFVQKEKLAE